ncbi:FAD-binding protein [Bacillus kwashiorkori]|uniref:FAD-binding protein n=1 Tax=Bacillus kwashiorkori TaxID=1522318 RepID=UPI000786772E|nr:FAD-binding protein [Bacillus kwashiorkori]
MTGKKYQWDRVVDVVVVGTGGAALTAATLAHDNGASVLVLEKSAQIGGTTAISGGVPWIPLNHYMEEEGIKDEYEKAKQYILRLSNGKEPDTKLIDVFLENGRKMIKYLHDYTPVKFAVPKGYGDYYADLPGGLVEGRSLDPLPFELNQLGEWAELIRRNPIFPPLTLAEGGADKDSIDYAVMAERMEKNITTMGRALIAALFKGLLDRGVETLVNTPGKKLIQNDAGEIIGVIAEQNGQEIYIGARKGVILATGGFEWNKELIRAFLPGEPTHPLSPPYNEGDGLIMAMEVGAALANMSDAWWYPATQDPSIEYEGRPFNIINSPRNLANSIIVNRFGKRFVNEGSTYKDMPRKFFAYDEVTQSYPNESNTWLIFDSQLKDNHLVVTIAPDEPAPEWMIQADSLKELASKIGVDPVGLEETVNRFNENAEKGVDPDFQRGTLYFEGMGRGGGSAELNLGPINKGPFYAIPIYFGLLGTSGGPRVDENGQVVNVRGEKIPGLYAAGNTAMAIFGPNYPGAGATIGPGMTWGYLSGKAVAKAPTRLVEQYQTLSQE